MSMFLMEVKNPFRFLLFSSRFDAVRDSIKPASVAHIPFTSADLSDHYSTWKKETEDRGYFRGHDQGLREQTNFSPVSSYNL